MTQEEKQLLLKDLCGRLPYGVKCQTKNGIGTLVSVECSFGDDLVYVDFGRSEAEEYDLNDGDTVKPYLRPMSSMTEEEYKEYDSATDLDVADSAETLRENLKAKTRVRISKWYHGTDWLDAHHFDYRGLIPMGLALEAPENMYKQEKYDND